MTETDSNSHMGNWQAPTNVTSAEAIAIGADLHRISTRHITREILDALELQIEAL